MAAYAYKYVRDRLPQFIIDKQVDYEGAGRKPAAGERSKVQTMTEQETELLLKAGAAAGLDVGVIHQRPHRRCAAGWTPWNPLEDDGDALRLAVDLGLSIEVHHDLSQTQAWLRVVDGDGTWTHCGPHEYNRDALAMTRRAIVTAAAKAPPHNVGAKLPSTQ